MACKKQKRLVECGHDVVILLDSITRLARAHNTVAPSSGKVLSGGVKPMPCRNKQFFGAARKIENGVRSPYWQQRWWIPAVKWMR